MTRRSLCGVSTWGVEDERWSWEDELFADIVVERRAVRRPFDQASDLEALLRGGGFDDVVVHAVHHEVTLAGPEEWWAWKWSYSLRGVLEQIAPTRLEQLQLTGSDSVAEIVHATLRAAAAIPRAGICVLDGHDHFAHKTDPAMVTAAVHDFVAS